jgi:hypothetical protein
MPPLEETLESYDEEAQEVLKHCEQLNPTFSRIHISTSTMYYKIDKDIPFSDPSLFNTSKFIETYPEKVKDFSIKANFGNALNFSFSLVNSKKSYCVLIFKSGFQIKGSKSAVSDSTIINAILVGYGLEDAAITELYPTMINANFDTHKILCLETMANYLTDKKLSFMLNTSRLRFTLVHHTDDVTKKITGIVYPSGKINLMGANRFEQITAFFAFVTKMFLDEHDMLKGDFVPEPPRPKGKPGRKRKLDKEVENDKLKKLLG